MTLDTFDTIVITAIITVVAVFVSLYFYLRHKYYTAMRAANARYIKSLEHDIDLQEFVYDIDRGNKIVNYHDTLQ